MIKINAGCGYGWKKESWNGIDYDGTSSAWRTDKNSPKGYINLDLRQGLPYKDCSVSTIYSSHCLEHFTYYEGINILCEFYRVLEEGGSLSIVVPDLDLFIENFSQKNRDFLETVEIIGGNPSGNLTDNFLMLFYSDPSFYNNCHKYAYNFDNLSHNLQKIGFEEINKVDFQKFTHCAELNQPEFKSKIQNIEKFSLSVECRKISHNPDYVKHIRKKLSKREKPFPVILSLLNIFKD